MADAIPLPDVGLAHYRFILVPQESLSLPRHLGSTLRGGFGLTFKRLVCLQRARETCDGCLLHHTCAYAYLFNPSPPPDAEVLRAQSDLPVPFLLEPPLDPRPEYGPGESLEFGLTLVGQAIDYLPYFVLAFRELGQQGLGRDRAHYALAQVAACHPIEGRSTVIYGRDEVLHDSDLAIRWPDLARRAESLSVDRLTVDFLTPTQIKHDGRFHQRPDFHVLVRALLRRVSALAYFYGGQQWAIDYSAWIARAEKVRTTAGTTRWRQAWRYSYRQQQRTNLSGAVGQMIYEGDLTSFRPLLALGEWIHVGKDSVFGNGMILVR